MKRSVILTDRLGPDILLVLTMKRQVLHREHLRDVEKNESQMSLSHKTSQSVFKILRWLNYSRKAWRQ